jgi:hypothetical protein
VDFKSSDFELLSALVKMDDKVEVNENEAHKGEVNEKETKSKRYMSADHTLLHNNSQ